MKKTAKFFSLILATLILFGAFGISASAEGTATVAVSTAQAAPGDTVKVDVVLSDCAQFSSYTIHISYDSEYVTCVDAKKGINTMLYKPNLTVDGKKTVAVVGGDVNNVTQNGTIATITFKVAEDYPGGITEVPLKVTQCKLTEYNGKNDVAIASQSVDGKLVISGAGSVIWNNQGNETEVEPAKLTDEQAAEYTNPLTGEGVAGGDYYVNDGSKIAIPATDVEEGIKTDPDTWKVVENDVQPASSEESDESAQGSEPASDKPEGELNWLLIACIAVGAVVIIGGIVAVVAIMKKKQKAQE